MVKPLIYALACLSLASFTFANKGDNKPLAKATACDTCVTVVITDTKVDDKPTLKSTGKDTSSLTTINVSLTKSISREELVYMVDSILDLDSISPKTIEMLTLLSNELNKPKEIKTLNSLPAADFYESFDETTCFVPVPEQTLPDTLKLV